VNDDAVILSLEEIAEPAFRRYAPDMAHIAERRHLDYRTAQFLVRPEAHFCCGGVRVDAYGATALPGLYAIGEVTGGCHGANRLANNAFPECYVFGKRAGEHAAGTTPASRSASLATLAQEHLHRLAQRATQSTDAPERYRTVQKALQQQMWEHVGVIRRTGTLSQAFETLQALATQAHDCRGDRPATVVRCLELDHLVLTAQAIALAALTRAESRGTHYREEFPTQNDAAWHCNVVVSQRTNGDLRVRQAPVVTS
jgi:succinate dehydrogenase/fumarate reductase flavoprotein subunit